MSLTLNDKITAPLCKGKLLLSFALIKKKLTAPSIGADMVDVSSVKTNNRQHVPTGVTCNKGRTQCRELPLCAGSREGC